MHNLQLLPEVVIYTDGACFRNGKPGALASAAAVILKDGGAQAVGEYLGHATSQMAEITGAIIGIKAVKEPSRITVYSDSQYLVNCASGRWNRHVNQKYWNKLDDVSQGHYVTYVWVRGHDGNYWNETADALAVQVLNARKVLPDTLDRMVQRRLTRAPAEVKAHSAQAQARMSKKELKRLMYAPQSESERGFEHAILEPDPPELDLSRED